MGISNTPHPEKMKPLTSPTDTIVISESFSLTLIAILAIITAWFLFEEIWDLSLFAKRSRRKEVKNLSTLRALSLFEHHDDIVAVDVRPRADFKKARLPAALNAPFQSEELYDSELDSLDRENPILVYCDGGFRSRRSLDTFVEAGFTKVFHLNRGILMWRLFGGPTENDSTAP